MPTSKEEIKPVVLVSSIFRKNKIKNNSLKISDYRVSDEKKNSDFLVENAWLSSMFSIEFLLKENELALAEKKAFENRLK